MLIAVIFIGQLGPIRFEVASLWSIIFLRGATRISSIHYSTAHHLIGFELYCHCVPTVSESTCRLNGDVY